MSEDLTSDEQADPAEDGLAHVLDCVTRLARPEGPCPDWRAEKSNEPDSPLRLLLSLPLCLIGVVDFGRARDRARGDPRGARPGIPEAALVVDEIARQLRFKINDADTAQVLVLIVAAEADEWRQVAKHVFGPDGSRGEQVVRVVSTRPVDLPASADGEPRRETEDEWRTNLELDLQVVVQSLPMFGTASVGDDDPAQFAQAAGSTAREMVEEALKRRAGSLDEDDRLWVSSLEEKVAAAFEHRDARSRSDIVARDVANQLCALVNVPAEGEPTEGKEGDTR